MAKSIKLQGGSRYLRLNTTFVWTGYEWQIEELGRYWLSHHLLNRVYETHSRLYKEFDRLFPGWPTIADYLRQVESCVRYPVFLVSPDPMFLRLWLDTWIEAESHLIWNFVFDTMKRNGADYRVAEKRAQVEVDQFEELFP
jgi:hypothetical protein